MFNLLYKEYYIMDSPKSNNKREDSLMNILFYLLLIIIILFVLKNANSKRSEYFNDSNDSNGSNDSNVSNNSNNLNNTSTQLTNSDQMLGSDTFIFNPDLINNNSNSLNHISASNNNINNSQLPVNLPVDSPDNIRQIIESNSNTPGKVSDSDEVRSKTEPLNESELLSISDIQTKLVNGKFRLKVNIPLMPNYIKGETFDTTKGKNPNYFYLCVEKIIPNCSIVTPTNTCDSIYIDDVNKCKDKTLTTQLGTNSFRLVLIASKYIESGLISSADFTLIKIGDNYYLKNILTGYYLSLFMNEKTFNLYGEINNNNKSNVADVFYDLYNATCSLDTKTKQFVPNKKDKKIIDPIITLNKPGTDFNPDKTMFLVTSNEIKTSSPVSLIVNSDNTLAIKIVRFNSYGQINEVYQLAQSDFNIKTGKGTGQINAPEPLGPTYVNLVSFVSDSTTNNKKLNFTVNIIEYPKNYNVS